MNRTDIALQTEQTGAVAGEVVDGELVAWCPRPGEAVALSLSEGAQQRRRNSMADNTVRAYARHVERYEAWCVTHGYPPYRGDGDGTVLGEFVNHLADTHTGKATIDQAVAAVRKAHAQRDLPRPDTQQARDVRDGYLREAPKRRKRRAAPATVRAIREMVAASNAGTAQGLRDLLLLVLGFSMAARRSELASVRLGDVVETEVRTGDLMETERGLTVYIPTSKTDQLGVGAEAKILPGRNPATNPVRLVRAWKALLVQRHLCTDPSAPLLRAVDRWDNVSDKPMSGEGVNRVIKRLAGAADLLGAAGYSGHSLRAGAATEARRAGAADQAIKDLGRWESDWWRVYIRAEDQWADHPLRNVGL